MHSERACYHELVSKTWLMRTCRDGRHRESERENAGDERHQARLVERGCSVQRRLDVNDDPAACCE